MSKRSRRPGSNAEPDSIIVKGAREHNLDVDYLEIPKKEFVVIGLDPFP